MRLVLTIFGLLLCVMPMRAQQYEGTVTNTEGRPIARVSVMFTDSVRNPISFTRSNTQGHFSLNMKTTKKIAYLLFTAVGYAKKEISIAYFKNGSTVIMAEKAMELKEVVVKDEPVKRSGDTLTYRVSAFKQAYDRSIEDVIAKMPGLRVDDKGIIYYNDQAIHNFYIEDMDMMGNQYVQASRNISADRVESVQVYEHHQEVKAMQGISKSDNVALNIKLKDNTKNIWTGSGDLALGLPIGDADRLLREWKLSPMMFAKNIQTLSLYKSNNIGTDLQPEIGSTMGEAGYNLIGNISYGTTFVDRKRSLFNDSYLLTTNWLYRPKRDTDLRLQLSGLLDHETGELTRETHYSDQVYPVVRTEQNTSDTYHQEWNGNLKFLQNKSRYMLSNQLSAHFDLSHSNGIAYLNGSRVEQYVKPHEIQVSNRLNYLKRIRHHSVSFFSDFDYAHMPATMQLYNQSIQTTQLNSMKWTNKASYVHNWKQLSFSGSVEGGVLFQDFHVDSPDTIARNLYRENYLALFPMISYQKGSWHFSLTPRVRLFNQSLEHQHQLRWLLEPEASINYNNHGLFSHSLHYFTIHTMGQLMQLTDIPLYQNYAFSTAGTGILRMGAFKTAYWTTNLNDVAHMINAGIRLSYSCNTTNSLYNNRIDADGLYNRSSRDRKNHMEFYNTSANIQKRFSWMQTSIGLDGSYGMNTYPLIVADNITKLRMYNTMLKGSVRMKPMSFLSMEMGLEYNNRHSRQPLTDNKTTSENYIGHLNVYFSGKQWLLSFTNWCSISNGDGQNNVWLSDLRFDYKMKRVDFFLKCSNLWNNDKIIRRGITVYEEIFSIYRLRPREIMAGVSFIL